MLEKAGLVEVRRHGRSSHYRVNRERLVHVVGGWLGGVAGRLRPSSWQTLWAAMWRSVGLPPWL